LWDIDCSSLEAYAAAWRTGLRRIWGLPFNSHCTIATLISMTMPVFYILCKRFVNRMINRLAGPNALVFFVVHQALQELGMASSLTRNLFRSSQHFCIASDLLLSRKLTSSDLLFMWNSRLSVEDVAVANATLELLFAREGHFWLDGFSWCDIIPVVDFVSVS
jgi:hypothetical protein